MQRGRSPKPDSMHLVQGTRSKVARALGHVSPDPEAVTEAPIPPLSLTQAEGQLEWSETAKLLIGSKVLKTADLRALEFYCIAVQTVLRAQREIDKDGIVVVGAMGGPVANPACAIQSKALAEARKWSSLLGLNPSARTRINVAQPASGSGPTMDDLSKPRRA